MYPLPVFQTIPDDLNAIDSRMALRHQNAFMKNALIRGLNTAYEVAPSLNSSHPRLRAFLQYVNIVLGMTRYHLDGDEVFFGTPIFGEQPFKIQLEMDGTPKDDRILMESIVKCHECVKRWIKNPNNYSSAALQELLGFGQRMITEMAKQLDHLCNEWLEDIITHEALKQIITDHIDWLAAHSDPSVLIPFIVAHHDTSTSIYWPGITPAGVSVIPQLMAKRSECWRFAPFNAITLQRQHWLS